MDKKTERYIRLIAGREYSARNFPALAEVYHVNETLDTLNGEYLVLDDHTA